MKILWLAPFPYPSKSTHPAPWISSLAIELAKIADTDLTILNYNAHCKGVEKFDLAPNIHVVFVKSPGLLIDLLTLASIRTKRLKDQIQTLGKFDIIHIHGSEHQYEYCVSKSDKNVVMSIQGILFEYIKYHLPSYNFRKYFTMLIYSILERRGLKRLNNFSCRTIWDTGIVRSLNPDAVVYNIWEVIRPDFHLKAMTAKGRDVYFTGGSNPVKGLNTALMAFTEFKKLSKSDAQFIVVGNVRKKDMEKLLKEAADPHIFPSIIFAGIINAEKIIAIQKNSLCHIHPSLIDNSPNSICESQLVGLPVVAIRTGGISSLVEHNITGFLVESINEMVASMMNLYRDDNLWNCISHQSRQVAMVRHNKNTIVENTVQMYQQLKRTS